MLREKLLKPSLILAMCLLPATAMMPTAAIAASATDKHKLKVVTTFTVIADMARNVAGDSADVVSITKPGAEIHEYQPTPQDIVRGSGADLILRNGFGLERWFDQFLDNIGDVPSVTLTTGIQPILIGAGEYAGYPNPHAWMGPDDALIYVDNIRAALVQHDPDNAAHYRANAAAYKARITAIVAPMQARIDTIDSDKRWLVTCEGAFGYLTRSLGLKELFLWSVNAEQNGTPQQVRKVIDGVRKHHIPAVFCESTVNTAPAQQVARETGAHFGGELYVDSLSRPDGPVPTYLDMLRVDTQLIADGLTYKNEDDK